MKSLHYPATILLVLFSSPLVSAGDFATDSNRPWSASYRSGTNSWSQPNNYSGRDYRSGPIGSARDASYWVERDPRYTPSLPQVARTSYRPMVRDNNYNYNNNYDGSAYCGYGGCTTNPNSGYAAVPPRIPAGNGGYYGNPPRYPSSYYPNQVSNGYYKGDGIFGKDTMFAKDQPIRNFFRYIMP